VACGDDGITSFDLLRHRRRDDQVLLYVFDLIELTGDDRRRDPLEQRELDLSRLLLRPVLAFGSTSGLMAANTTARPSSFMPASSGSKASSQS